MAKTSNKTVYIYGLVDPISNKIRYVGKSINPDIRLEQHIKDQSHVYRTHWIHGLLERGLRPICIILEVVEPSNDWEASERYWITKGHREGWPLTNHTSGGEGLRDPSPETRTKMSKSQRERPPPSKETLARRSAALKGRTRTEEWKKKISNSLVGHPVSEYTRQMLSMAGKGRKCTVAAIAKSSKAMKALWADPNSIFNSKEFRDKQAASHTGHPVSEETRQKLRGENSANAKLTSEEVLEIRHLISVGDVSRKDLAMAFGVSVGNISHIANFRSWKHLRE